MHRYAYFCPFFSYLPLSIGCHPNINETCATLSRFYEDCFLEILWLYTLLLSLADIQAVVNALW